MEIFNRLPLYALRAYEEIWEEGGYTLISTNWRTYVLDCKSLEGDYSHRRLQLMVMELPHKLYRIDERFRTLPQLILTKRTNMLDKDGNVVRYRKSKWLNVEYTKVLRNDQTWKGNYRLMTKLNAVFLSDTPSAYVGYIRHGHSIILFEKCNELKKTRRVKI